MQINNSTDILTKEGLFKYITPLDVFAKYMEKPIFDKAFSSPFREDRHPSFLISSKKKIYIDFATGERGDCISFVKKLYNINFNDALIQIAKDFGIDNRFIIFSSSATIYRQKKAEIQNVKSGKRVSGIFNLQIKSRKFNGDDIAYWDSYGISRRTLDLVGIVAISHFFLDGTPFVAEKYAYAFIENKDSQITYKIYQPYSTNRKWINNNNYSIWEMWNCLPSTGSELIITSSRKDAASIYENTLIPATALQSETTIPKKKVINELSKRFQRTYLLYDNDLRNKDRSNPGQQSAEKLKKLFPSLINIKIPDKYNIKDFSDFVYKHGREEAVIMLKNLINGMDM